MKTAIYARVSSDSQDVDLSISAQLGALRDYAVKHGYQIVREFVDEAEQLLVPYEQAKNINFNCLNELIKYGDIEKALDYSDSVLLIQGLGLKTSEVRQFRSIWHRLRERRSNRKNRKVNNVMTK